MNLWLASTDAARVETLFASGLFVGVLTNPQTLAAAGRPAEVTIDALCTATTKPVFYQLKDAAVDDMKRQADAWLARGHANLGIKVAVTPNGLAVLGWLREQQVRWRLATAVTGLAPMLLAVAAGAGWITPSGSALQKLGGPTKPELLGEMQAVLDRQAAETQLIPSLSSPGEMVTMAQRGVRAGFCWDQDVEGFLADPLVADVSESFAPAWRQLESMNPAGA